MGRGAGCGHMTAYHTQLPRPSARRTDTRKRRAARLVVAVGRRKKLSSFSTEGAFRVNGRSAARGMRMNALPVSFPVPTPRKTRLRGPANPFVARNPLATGRLPANDCCMLRPGHAHAGPRGTHVPLSVRLHVRARAIRLLKRADTNRRRDPGVPARRAQLPCFYGPHRRADGNDMISRRRSPRFSSAPPP